MPTVVKVLAQPSTRMRRVSRTIRSTALAGRTEISCARKNKLADRVVVAWPASERYLSPVFETIADSVRLHSRAVLPCSSLGQSRQPHGLHVAWVDGRGRIVSVSRRCDGARLVRPRARLARFRPDAMGTDGYWFPDYVADLDALLDHYAPDEPARLVGHSLGGNVVCAYAGARPRSRGASGFARRIWIADADGGVGSRSLW